MLSTMIVSYSLQLTDHLFFPRILFPFIQSEERFTQLVCVCWVQTKAPFMIFSLISALCPIYAQHTIKKKDFVSPLRLYSLSCENNTLVFGLNSKFCSNLFQCVSFLSLQTYSHTTLPVFPNQDGSVSKIH